MGNKLTPNDEKDLSALVKELIETGRASSKQEGASVSFKDGADVVYKLLGISVVLLGLILWMANNRSDINANREAIAGLRAEIATMRGVYDRLEDRVRAQEQKMAKVEK